MIEHQIYLLIINFLLFKFSRLFFFKFNLLDKPEGKLKFHKKSTPYNGGFALFINLIIIYGVYQNDLLLGYSILNIFYLTSLFTLVFLMCFIDDVFNISPNIRFIFSILILAVFFIIFPEFKLINLRFNFINYSVEFEKYSLPLSIFCMLAFIQAINMLDGINGQVAIYFLSLLILLSLLGGKVSLYLIPFLLIFLFNNLLNKSFLGDSGSYLLAIITGLLLINFHQEKLLYADDIFLMICVPGFEMIRLFVHRIAKGKNPFYGDRDHIHHLFLKKLEMKKAIFCSTFIITSPCLLFFILQNNLITFFITLTLYVSSIFILKINK